MTRETKKPKQIVILPSVVKKAAKLQKEMNADSFSDLVEKLILNKYEAGK